MDRKIFHILLDAPRHSVQPFRDGVSSTRGRLRPLRPRDLDMLRPTLVLALGTCLTITVLVLPRSSTAQVAVTTCGQVVEGAGYLTGNLDCTGFTAAPFAVLVHPKGSLDLRGFAVIGAQDGVDCGSILVDAVGQENLHIYGRCDVSNGTIRGAAIGLTVESLQASNLAVTDNALEGVLGINRAKATLVDSIVSGNGTCGVSANSVKVFTSSITGNEGGGLCSRRVRMFNSSATGNGLAPDCTRGPCVDVSATRRPHLRDSTCDRSGGNQHPPGNWHVCALD